ncbi:hypothetical protein ACIRYZ_27790 [Kitasatospora sp. NPDC101155]|uniref:hypothetical protein n=1 Tax=Kitasatospora sp. NPDC101155 TaxID=3364097 RepID=UPI00382037D3
MDQERVELAYRPTGEDFREAIAQTRRTLAGWLPRIAPSAMAAFTAFGLAAKLADGQPVGSDAVTLAALMALVMFTPRLQVMLAQRRAARRGGEYRAVVDGSGVSVTDGIGIRTLSWTAGLRFAETRNLFVVLNRSGTCLLVLPKRGTPAPDALRALLTRHATPIGRQVDNDRPANSGTAAAGR